MRARIAVSITLTLMWVLACVGSAVPVWEADNPIRPLSPPPLGMEFYFAEAKTFTDNKFWNEGIGWRPELMQFSGQPARVA